jgi:hypothetical protein
MACLGLVAAMPLVVDAACMDGHPSVTSELKDSTMVVVGTAAEAHNIPDPEDPEGYIYTIYVIKVSEVLKGPAPPSFWLYSENTTARYPMDLGKPHLLFVEQSPNLNYVSSCGNSGPMGESQRAYRAVKRVLAKPSNAQDAKAGTQ